MKILFSITSGLKETVTPALGLEIANLFASNTRLAPETLYFGDTQIAEYATATQFAENWPGRSPDAVWGLRWKRKRVARYEAEFHHAFVNKNGRLVDGGLVFVATDDGKTDWEALFCDLCAVLQAETATFLFYDGQLRTSTSVFSTEDTRKLAVTGHMICVSPRYHAKDAVEHAAKAGFPVIPLGSSTLFKVLPDMKTSMADRATFDTRRRLLAAILNGE